MVDVTEACGAQVPTQATPHGWYLFGITARDTRLGEHLRDIPGMAGGGALRAIEQGAVAAIVQPVPLAEFGSEALEARLEDIAWIELTARRHHGVIVALHRRRALLPARFGAVYPSPDGLRGVLAEMQDALRAHLARVADCDEWEVRLFCERAELLGTLDTIYPALAALRREMEAAPPGRAYLLRRKLDDERDRAAAVTLSALAEAAHGNLAQRARASQVNLRAQTASHARQADATGSEEGKEGDDDVLRASFLVPRAEMEAFTAAMERFAALHLGTRWTCTGPWPPYSFATPMAAPVAGTDGEAAP